MRWRVRPIMALALVLAPPSVRAQEPVPPVSAIQKCSVASDEEWTPQEKFVWARTCAGGIADFNLEATYGGKLDPGTAAGLPESRVLRSAFIERVLTDNKYRSAITRYGVRITGARFKEPVDLQNAELRNELWFEQCLFENGADLSWVSSTQPIAFNTSKVTGTLNLYAAEVALDLKMANSRIAAVSLVGARVGRTLDLGGSTVTGTLDMEGIEVGSNLLIEGANLTAVNLPGARVGHKLNLSNSKITGELQMDSLQVGVHLQMDDATLAEVILFGARVRNQVTLDRTKVTGPLRMLEIRIDADLRMTHAEFSARIDLRNAQIGGQLDWSGSAFRQTVDLTGTHVGGALSLKSPQGEAQWSKNASLILHYAKIEIIPNLSDAWPDKLELDGLTYRGIGTVGDDFEKWFDRMGQYSRQPYEQLASVLQAQGNSEKATAIRYAARDRERRESPSWAFAAWLTLLDGVIGYGYYPYRSFVWVVLLVIFGAIVLRVSGQGPKNAMPIGLSYSFDMLLPIIRLREKHYAIDLAGFARYYFYCHKIMGWVLASFLLAGLSGLTK